MKYQQDTFRELQSHTHTKILVGAEELLWVPTVFYKAAELSTGCPVCVCVMWKCIYHG